jgi:type I site-specific restriction endonuclease
VEHDRPRLGKWESCGAENQARDDAARIGVPFVLLANGREIWFRDFQGEARPHQVRMLFRSHSRGA